MNSYDFKKFAVCTVTQLNHGKKTVSVDGRSSINAVKQSNSGLMQVDRFVLDADISRYCNKINHENFWF